MINTVKFINQGSQKQFEVVQQMESGGSIYLSVLQNSWQTILDNNFDHSLNQQKVCTLLEQSPEIIRLKQKYPETNVQIQHKDIKPVTNGIYIGPLNKQNQPSGYGLIRYEDKSIVQAKFLQGKANGKGFKYFGPGWYYVGQFVNNNFEGRGEYISPQISYIGEFKNNTFHGQGQLRLPKKDTTFIGTMQNGQMKNGNLTWQIKNPKDPREILYYQYQGGFLNGKFHDQNGILISKAGIYKGQFKQGMKDGMGRFEFIDKYQYIGTYEKNLKKGYGTLYNPQITKYNNEEIPELSELDKNISYQGEFDKNLPHGKGQIYREPQGRLVAAEYEQGIWIEAIRNAID